MPQNTPKPHHPPQQTLFLGESFFFSKKPDPPQPPPPPQCPKPTKPRRWQMVVVANDHHVPFHDEQALALFCRFLRRERPDWLILNGDFQDFWEVSRFDLTPRMGKEFREEIAIGRRILRSLRRMLP